MIITRWITEEKTTVLSMMINSTMMRQPPRTLDKPNHPKLPQEEAKEIKEKANMMTATFKSMVKKSM